MRLHVISLPHTQVTDQFASCAFTQKVVRFCDMMTNAGHEVFLYAGSERGPQCQEHITCVDPELQRIALGGRHYTTYPFDATDTLWRAFNGAAIAEMQKRVQPHDVVCLIGGHAQLSIAQAFPQNLSVEYGIGYSGTFAQFRVFESYAWMHMVYGAESGGAEKKDGHWFDDVIPNQFDDRHTLGPGGDYALYVGRLIDRKGFHIAQTACQHAGVPLVLAGPGEARGSGYGEFVGEVGPARRVELMRNARCLLAPTQYIEPFGTVTVEAMACGTPVVSTDWGAFTETVPAFAGFRCRMHREFVSALEQVQTLDRAKIRQHAESRFSMPVVQAQYDRYFERLATLWGKGWYAE